MERLTSCRRLPPSVITEQGGWRSTGTAGSQYMTYASFPPHTFLSVWEEVGSRAREGSEE